MMVRLTLPELVVCFELDVVVHSAQLQSTAEAYRSTAQCFIPVSAAVVIVLLFLL